MATLAGFLFLFVVWLIVRLTGSSEPLLNPSGDNASLNAPTTLMEPLAESTTTLPDASSSTLASLSPATTVASASRKGSGSAKKSGSAITMVLMDPTTSTLVPTTTLASVSQVRVKREDTTAASSTVPATSASRISIPAYHDHWKGDCFGTLTLSDQSVVFTPEKGDHNFQSSIVTLRRMDLKPEKSKLRLSLKSEEGKDFNFDVADPQAMQQLKTAFERITRHNR